jgi:phosphocarrier protein HPr
MQKSFTIVNPTGIHARPARKIVETAKRFPFDIFLEKDGNQFSAKSLVKVLSVGAKMGDTVTVVAEGEQAEAALDAVGEVLASTESH